MCVRARIHIPRYMHVYGLTLNPKYVYTLDTSGTEDIASPVTNIYDLLILSRTPLRYLGGSPPVALASRRSGRALAFTRYFHCQYCMVCGKHKGGRMGVVCCVFSRAKLLQ